MSFEKKLELLKKEIFVHVEQCEWRCPECHARCGGVKDHSGPHQCPRHYNPTLERNIYVKVV